MTKLEMAREIYENLGSEGMEAVLTADHEVIYRQSGSFGEYEFEKSALGTIELSPIYWDELMQEWELDYNEQNDSTEDFIHEVILPIIEYKMESIDR